MKSQFVADLADGQAVASLFLVREKEIRKSARTGSSWLQLELSDRTGTIPAKMWDNFATLAAVFERDDVIQIRGRVKLYNGQKELTIEQIIPAAERDYDLGDFLPHTKHDVEKLYADLRAAIAGMKNPWLKQLAESIVEDPAIAPRLKRAPAAMTMHHAFLGGLLEHIVGLVNLSHAVALCYPELDSDLLLTGVIVHDIGKIDELRYGRAIDYSTQGRLLGHIMIGSKIVAGKIAAIQRFPPSLEILVQHLILSHHGSLEFGSPSLPQTREAIALHFIDDMDSKMAAMRATLDTAAAQGGADVWSGRDPALRRSLLQQDKFIAAEQETSAKPTAASVKTESPGKG